VRDESRLWQVQAPGAKPSDYRPSLSSFSSTNQSTTGYTPVIVLALSEPALCSNVTTGSQEPRNRIVFLPVGLIDALKAILVRRWHIMLSSNRV